jgi:hypothetical protein
MLTRPCYISPKDSELILHTTRETINKQKKVEAWIARPQLILSSQPEMGQNARRASSLTD